MAIPVLVVDEQLVQVVKQDWESEMTVDRRHLEQTFVGVDVRLLSLDHCAQLVR